MIDAVNNEYFEWMYNMVCDIPDMTSYRNVLMFLHQVEFVYTINMDSNRMEDGLMLRRIFASEVNDARVLDVLNTPCSVLEMMVALAHRCEEHIMDDDNYGNRTSEWFWVMMTNSGLNEYSDDNYDEKAVRRIVKRLLTRTYRKDGSNGWFPTYRRGVDMRATEIWYQMCYYLDDLVLKGE